MPQLKLGSRGFVDSNKCDANLQKYGELDDSPPPNSNFDFYNYWGKHRLQNGGTFRDGGRKVVSDKNRFPHSQLSVLADDKHNCDQKEEAKHDLDFNIGDSLTSTSPSFGGKKTPLNYDAVRSRNLKGYSKTDKIKAKSEDDLQEKSLSDLLATISTGEKQNQGKPSLCNAFAGTPKYSGNGNVKQTTDAASNCSFNLSDLLTSISLLDENKHQSPSLINTQTSISINASLDPNKYTDATVAPNLTDLYKELNNSNSTLNTKGKTENGFISSQVKVEENLSDILSTFDINDLTPPVQQKESPLKVLSTQTYQDFSNVNTSPTENNSIMRTNNGSKGNFYDEKYITKTGDLANDLLGKSNEFTFFDTTTNHLAAFSSVFDQLDVAENALPSDNDRASDCSMLDLFKSVNHVAGNKSMDLPALKDEPNLKFENSIDLTTCLKTNENTHDLFLSSVMPNDAKDENICDSIWSEENVMPNTQTDLTIPIPHRVNLKRSLFAKCLQCKPKRDSVGLQKVASIKRILLQNLFYPEMSSELSSKSVDVKFSDDPIFDFTGRHTFGMSTC